MNQPGKPIEPPSPNTSSSTDQIAEQMVLSCAPVLYRAYADAMGSYLPFTALSPLEREAWLITARAAQAFFALSDDDDIDDREWL